MCPYFINSVLRFGTSDRGLGCEKESMIRYPGLIQKTLLNFKVFFSFSYWDFEQIMYRYIRSLSPFKFLRSFMSSSIVCLFFLLNFLSCFFQLSYSTDICLVYLFLILLISMLSPTQLHTFYKSFGGSCIIQWLLIDNINNS